MNEIITEKNHPIQNIWLFKQISYAFLGLPIVLLVFTGVGGGANFSLDIVLFVFFPVFVLMYGIPIITNALSRAYFHYSLDEHFMILHQGIISKQNRNVPYGRIQGVFLNQGLFDRIFGLTSLTIEDFSDGGRSIMNANGSVGGKSSQEVIGFVGNKIHIPGLKKGDAEELKAIILQKVKENPIEDSQSGL
ncbi:MAG: PH domain-containing protein [Candidatus Jorgensenbacteria bacterium]|nr:PH domain-containing protein [Candidatus Jorgensenbacteria bacterium]